MILLYEGFENAISGRYIEENDRLSILAQQLEETKMFQDTIIYIDEFAGFTHQEYEIIRKLIKVAEVTITICTEDLDLLTYQDSDIFYSNKQMADKLLFMAKQQEIVREKTIFLKDSYRFQTEELKFLEKNIFAKEIYTGKVENVELFLANDIFSEIENVAKKISFLVREEQYRWREIAVITKNLETYSSLTKVIFEKYDIPVFIDEKKGLSQNLLIQYITSILEIFSKNWSYESIFTYLKTGFLEVEEAEIYELEKYCLKWGIKGKKWLSDWTFGEDMPKAERMNVLREQIIQPLVNLKQKLMQNKTVEDFSKTLYLFLLQEQIHKKIEENIAYYEEREKFELAKEYKLSWEILIEVLEELVLVLKQESTTFTKYIELLKTGLNNSSLGKIPGTQDQVTMGDIDRSRSHKIRSLFILGINDGVFPSVNKNEGFLGDKDREYLKEKKIELAKGSLEKLYEDNFNIYKAFSTAEEKLFLSYSSQDIEGKNLRPSTLISKIKKIFPNLKEESDIIEKKPVILHKTSTFEELINQLRNYKEGEEIEEKWFAVFFYYWNQIEERPKLESALKAMNYLNMPEVISEGNIDKLYGNTLKTSISKLEQYRSCPFSYYLKYGLKLEETEEFKVRALDTGNFMHETIDRFFEILQEREISVKEIEEEVIKEILEEIINEKLHLNKNYIFTSTSKYRILVSRLKKVIAKSIKYIIESIKYSDFEIAGNEIEFKDTIFLEKGRQLRITGKIDRMDTADNFVRIIDYKSSSKDIDLNEVRAGLQLQLLTYMGAICEKENFMPAAVLYYNLIDPMIKTNKNKTEEEIEKEVRKNFRMKGLVVSDIKVIKMMDKKLEQGSSEMIPVYIDSKGNVSDKRSSVVSKEEFDALQKYTRNLIKQIAEEIYSGDISIKPYYAKTKNKKSHTPCEYCNYRAICNFKAGCNGNYYNYIKKEDNFIKGEAENGLI